MSHCLKPIIYKEYSYLFNEIKCPICGKIFTLNYDKILRTYRNLKKNLNVFLCCSSSCSSKYMLQKLGNPSKLQWVKDKKEKTFYKNHGCKHNWASKDPKLNGRTTRKERYGKESFAQTDKYKALWQDKERTKRIMKKQHDTKEKNGTLPGNPKSLKKLKDTLSKRTKEEQQRINNKQQETKKRNGTTSSSFLFQQKRYNTMKRNGTLGGQRSKQEIRCFELLKTKFPDAEHSYRDNERYPFSCDMYIPSLDLFIECHFGFAHGGEPFDFNNQKHLEEVERCRLKQEEIRFDGKKKKSYAEKIKVWTESDPLKLEIFHKNNLNYKIFYTEKEFGDWIENVTDSTR